MPLSPSIEKYIRKIYIANSKGIKVTGSYLASELKISSAAITDMAHKLNAQGLIKYQKHKELKLTAKGKKAALKVIRKHRLWESFLHKSLGLNLEEIHTEAEILEHFGSRKLMNRIDKFLDYPQYDPHGDPIPDSEGKLPEEQNYPSLNECEPGKYEIHRVYYDNSDVSNFFVEYDFKVGKLVELALHFKMDHAVLLKVDKTTIVINENIASKIFVRPVRE
jgi:DtxR family Mn-dependent transcriptional regulator